VPSPLHFDKMNLVADQHRTSNADDYDLMAAIADRDRVALERLYDRYSPIVLASCIRIIGDRDEAEDCLIDIFAEIWEKFDRYDPLRSPPLAYLMLLTRSRAQDRRRRRAARPSFSTGQDETQARRMNETPDPSPASQPAQATELAEARTTLRATLSQLGDSQKQAIEFAYYQGLSHSEIAEKLGKPLGKVKTYIPQGLMQLRYKLCRNA